MSDQIPTHPKSTITTNRRQWLLGGSATVAAVGMAGLSQSANAFGVEASTTTTANGATPSGKPLPAYVAWKDPSAMIVHSNSTLETKRSAFGTSVITPINQLYVRNNLPAPDASIVADRDSWNVQIEGVKNPQTLSVKQLKSMGLATVATVLQCSGNGRGLFPSKPSGTPWQVGAAGCVIWSGVPVRALIQALGGVVDGMVYMTGTGGEKIPAGLDAKSVMVERSVPLKAMEDAILAWELNGEPIPLAHGGPLRLIVPGYMGVNNVKYIKRLAFTVEQTDAAIHKTGYRISAPGQKGDPSQPSVWEIPAKSWINTPSPETGDIRAGDTLIKGVAFGGMHAVKQVEVSTDNGQTWTVAQLVGPDLGRYAWRQFVLGVKLVPGSYILACRVTDDQGNLQAEHRQENAGGYNNASWRDHALKITVVA